MNKLIIYFLEFFLLVFNLGVTSAQMVYESPKKKLIDFSRHSPYIQYYKDHIADYEHGPFDGITLKLSKEVRSGNIFMVDDWEKVTADAKDKERKLVASLKESTVLKDNFLVLFGASQMDWFSDEDWAKTESHLRYGAQMAKLAHCKGILWDPEPYKPGKNPWNYKEQEKSDQHSYQDYYYQVRKRGAQFIKILQEEYPGLVIFSLRELSDWQQGSPFSTPLFPVNNKDNTINKIENAWWGLHIPFYVGILDAINPEVDFIDGNEEAYYYVSELEFYKVRSTLIDDAKSLIPPGLWVKHTRSFKLGHAIAPEYIQGNWLGMRPFPYRLTGQGVMMSAAEKALWLEHNTYYALKSSDEYAWTWAEAIDWWTGDNLPEGFTEALIKAKKKVAEGKALGFEIDQMIKAAQDKAEAFYKDK